MASFSEKTRSLVRWCVHPETDTMDDSFRAVYAFRDAGSRFSILKSIKTAPGPDECFGLWQLDPRRLFEKLLGLEIAFPDCPHDLSQKMRPYNSMNYYRSHVEEWFYVNGAQPLPPLEGRCDMHFAAADHLVISYALRNTAACDLSLVLRWHSVPDAGLECLARADSDGFHFANRQRVGEPYRAWAELHGPQTEFAWDGAKFESQWLSCEIPPHGEVHYRFEVFFDAAPDGPLAELAAPEKRSFPVTPRVSLAAAIAETEANFAALPALPERFARFERLVLTAAGTLQSLRYLDRDREGRDAICVQGSKTGVGATWFWDSAFVLMGLGLAGDRDAARGTAKLVLDGIAPDDGMPPVYYSAGKYAMGYQQPIYAWGIANFCALKPDEDLVARSYEPLTRYVRHWQREYSDARNGLVVHPPGGSCWDDSLRWQSRFPIAPASGERWHDAKWGEMRLDLFHSVDTNTHLYLEYRVLAQMASALGKNEDAAHWERAAQTLGASIERDLFNPEAGIYQDKSVDGRFNDMVTPASLLPIYAGLTPPDTAQRLCREWLLSPDHFYTALPFPTLDRSHPAFRSGGFLHPVPEFPGALVQHAYWTGRTWPHNSFWMVAAIHAAGLHAEADAAAEKVLDALSRTESIHECYDPLTGAPNGHAEFPWPASAVLGLAFEYYKRGPLGSR